MLRVGGMLDRVKLVVCRIALYVESESGLFVCNV